jgi:hypothetical protein
LPFFFLETEQEGEGNGRMGGTARPWEPAPWCMATPGEEEKTERRPRGSDFGPHLVRRRSTEAVHRDGWWPAMVSGGGELQREVEEGRCWGGVGGVRGGSGADL